MLYWVWALSVFVAMVVGITLLSGWPWRRASVHRRERQRKINAILSHAEVENARWLSGDPLAMYGDYPPDPLFAPHVEPPEPPAAQAAGATVKPCGHTTDQCDVGTCRYCGAHINPSSRTGLCLDCQNPRFRGLTHTVTDGYTSAEITVSAAVSVAVKPAPPKPQPPMPIKRIGAAPKQVHPSWAECSGGCEVCLPDRYADSDLRGGITRER